MDRTKLLIIGIVLGILVLGAVLYLFFTHLNIIGRQQQPVTLQMWGVFDDPQFYETAIRTYEQTHKNVQIIYRSFTFDEYEQQLLNSFAAGTGPDIWLMHNTWLVKHADKIEPLPDTIPGQKKPLMLFKDFQDQFVDVAVKDLTAGGTIYAVPLYIDTLGLYYNKDIFNSVGITQPPRTYEELNSDVQRITALDNAGNIRRSGAALGTARNINRSTDVLMMLMLQSGVKMTNDSGTGATFAQSVERQPVGQTALQYYTDFANANKQVYTWNAQQHYSIDAFTNGETAMMFNYSHHIQTIRAKSSRFNFGIAPVPQIAGSPKNITFANYWAPTVAKQSKHVADAWEFLVYLASKEGAISYLNASNRPSARRDLIEIQKNDPDLGIFAAQALTATSWLQVDNTAIESIFADMIDAVNFGRASIQDALEAAEHQVNILMSKIRR